MKKSALNRNNKILSWGVILLQFIASSVTIYGLLKLHLLPEKYTLPLILVLILLFVGMVFWNLRSTKYPPKIISVLVSILILFGSFYIYKTSEFTGTITGANKDTHTINAIVLIRDHAEGIKDVVADPIGANTRNDAKSVAEAKKLINEIDGLTVNVTDYDNYSKLLEDFYSGKIRTLLVSGGQLDLINSLDSEFETKIRTIAQYTYEESTTTTKERPDVLTDTFTIFLSGIDMYGPISSVSRSDVNMLITVNPVSHQILLTSIPRDYYVELGTIGEMDKLTHAGLYGVNESIVTLEKLFDVNIDFYLRVNFSSITKIIDALGGVDVETKYSFTTNGGGFTFHKGVNHVDSAAALAFVRERYNLPNGDNDRVYHQQQMIKAIMNKIISPAIIVNYGSLLNAVSGVMEMSVTEQELNAIIRDQIDKGRGWDFQQYVVLGTGGRSTTTYSMPGPSLYIAIPDVESVNQAHAYIQAMEDGETINVDEGTIGNN